MRRRLQHSLQRRLVLEVGAGCWSESPCGAELEEKHFGDAESWEGGKMPESTMYAFLKDACKCGGYDACDEDEIVKVKEWQSRYPARFCCNPDVINVDEALPAYVAKCDEIEVFSNEDIVAFMRSFPEEEDQWEEDQWEEEQWEEDQWEEEPLNEGDEFSCPYMLNTVMFGWDWEYDPKIEKPYYISQNYYYYDGGVTPWMKKFEPEHLGYCMEDLKMFGEHLRGVTLCDICCETCAEAGQTCGGPPPGGCVKAGWRYDSDDCAEGEVAERTCPSFEGAEGMGKAGWEQRNEWMIPAATAGAAADAGDAVKVIAVRTQVLMSAESMDEMLKNPKRAVRGLTSGIASGLGVHRSLVKITKTDPDLLSDAGRRLSENKVAGPTVPFSMEFEVDVSQGEVPNSVIQTLDKINAGDKFALEGMAESVTAGLAKLNVEVKIAGVSTETPLTPSTAKAPPAPAKPKEKEVEVSSGFRDLVGVGFFAAIVLQLQDL